MRIINWSQTCALPIYLAVTNQPGPLIYANNQHFNQSMAGSRFYHAWQGIVDNLLYEGIRGEVASDATYQGYAAWIDNFGPANQSTRSQYGAITMRNCVGLGKDRKSVV